MTIVALIVARGELIVAETPAREAIGRSRGGLTTKIHTLVDGRGRSLATLITPGQAADTRQLIPLFEQVRVARPGGIGRPRFRTVSVTGDKAYSSRADRQALRGKQIRATTSEPNGQIANRKRRGSRGRRRCPSWRTRGRCARWGSGRPAESGASTC